MVSGNELRKRSFSNVGGNPRKSPTKTLNKTIKKFQITVQQSSQPTPKKSLKISIKGVFCLSLNRCLKVHKY
jgi:hypothetical protein